MFSYLGTRTPPPFKTPLAKYLNLKGSRIPVSANGTNTLELKIARESPFVVKASTIRGAPVDALRVRIDRADGLMRRHVFVDTNTQGEAHFSRLGAGEHTIFARPMGRGFPCRAKVTLTAGTPAALPLRIRETGTLKIRVLNSKGEAVEGLHASITVKDVDDTAAHWLADGYIEAGETGLDTNNKGEIELRGAPEGEATVTVEGSAPGLCKIEPGKSAEVTLLVK